MSKHPITEAIGVDIDQFRELSGMTPAAHGGLKVMGEGHERLAAEEGVGVLAEDKKAHAVMMKLREGDKVRIESPGLPRPRVVTVTHGPQKQGKVIYVGLTSGKPWGRNPKGGALLYRKDAMYGTEPDEVAFQATLSQRPVVVTKLTPMSAESVVEGLDPGAKELLRSIAQKADENGITWVSDLDQKLVRKYLSDLQWDKLISRSGSKKNAVVKLTAAGKKMEAIGAGFDEGGDKLTPESLINYLKTAKEKHVDVMTLAYSFKLRPQKVKAMLAKMVKAGQLVSKPSPAGKTLRYSLPEATKDKRRKELERLVWKHTHRDYKGKYQGQKTVLTLGPKGTTMVAIADMSDEELLKKIPSRFRPTD